MWPTGGLLESRATQTSAGNQGLLSFCCVTFYSARQANANLESLAITMKKQPRLSSINSTLTSQLVPSISGMFGD